MLDMELGTRVDLETMFEEDAGCEWPGHFKPSGEVSENHSDGGAEWLVTVECPCGKSGVNVKVCDGAHKAILYHVKRKTISTVYDCHECSGRFKAADIYVRSVKFG